MRLLSEINILTNKKLVFALNILSFLLVLVFALFFNFLASILAPDKIFFTPNNSVYLLFFIVFLVLHELIHGLFFKCFNWDGKVKFGFSWKTLMAYATSPGSLYNRHQMLIISLSPFVLISLGLTFAFVWGWLPYLPYILLVSWHAGACVGDFYYTYLLLVKFGKEQILVEDTLTGIKFYEEN